VGHTIRLATPTEADATTAGGLIDACMRELFAKSWSGTGAQLAADLAAGHIAIALARDAGFISWAPGYDLHHCVRGGEVADLYVTPAARGSGLVAQLVAFACAEVARSGGVFLRGTAVASAAPLYRRVAWSWSSDEIILGGRAFRALADLAGQPARTIVRGLPPPAWNHQ
jgi:GNAT superfamily N-acetyltransferase